jgi:hypothetical protein
MRISTSDTSKDDMSEPRFPQLLTVVSDEKKKVIMTGTQTYLGTHVQTAQSVLSCERPAISLHSLTTSTIEICQDVE